MCEASVGVVMNETFEYVEEYHPKDGPSRYASATLRRSSCRWYWETMETGWRHRWVMNDFGYLTYVGGW